jgi:serine/threonine-protein kinase RsbW
MKRTVNFPGQYASLADISKLVVEAAREAGLSDSQVYAVDLAVDEACTNIIEHAYGGEGLGEIRCSCETDERGLTVTIQDHGHPFNPSRVPPPNHNAKLKDVKPGGAGLYLIYKMMDEVYFKFNHVEGNVLKLVKFKKTG